MTQTDLQPTAAPVGSGWRDFASWLTAKRVTLWALVLVAIQVGLNSYVLNRGFFQQDDFVIAALASHSLNTHLLFYNYAGHLFPGTFALAWALVHSGGGYDWGLWAGSLVALQALAGLALLRALRTMFGNRMAILVPLGVFLFTPMTVPVMSWWAPGMGSVPFELVIPLAVDQHVRYVRDGRIRNAVFAAFWVLFGMAFYEKSVGIVLLLFALTTAYLVPGGWSVAVRTTLRRHWLGWALQAAAVVTEIVVYSVSLSTSAAKPKVPQAGTFAQFGWDLLGHTFVPSAFGGPWHWAPASSTASSWLLYAVASAPPVLTALSWVLAVLVVAASLWYRSRAWRAWLIMLGWLVIVDTVPVALGRVAVWGTQISSHTLFVADAAPVLAVCLALAFLPLRGEEHPYRARLKHPSLRVAATGALAVVFVVGAVSSDVAYRAELQPANTRSYLATASSALASAPAGSVIYPTFIPATMAMPLFGSATEVENALGPLINQNSGQDFRFAWPSGKANFLIFDGQGRLSPAEAAGPSTQKPPNCVLSARGMQLQLSSEVFAVPLLMQIPYFSSQPVTLGITFGGNQYRLTLPASSLTTGYLPVEGPGTEVVITPLSPDPHICIGAITVGNVQAVPGATPIPPAPLTG